MYNEVKYTVLTQFIHQYYWEIITTPLYNQFYTKGDMF